VKKLAYRLHKCQKTDTPLPENWVLFKTSMLQDVEAGKAVELDALVSVVRELGQLTQVSTPYTDALLGLSRLHARVHGLYPAQ